MKLININTQQHVRTFLFPDNQPHIQLEGIAEGDEVKVICSMSDANIVLQLLQCANALDHAFAKKKELHIPYLMGARFDRVMQSGDSFVRCSFGCRNGFDSKFSQCGQPCFGGNIH
jgi:ribose-phosphate pyrophosphokinase